MHRRELSEAKMQYQIIISSALLFLTIYIAHSCIYGMHVVASQSDETANLIRECPMGAGRLCANSSNRMVCALSITINYL